MGDYPDWTRLFHLVGTDITIPINIEASDVTLPVSIVSQEVFLYVTVLSVATTVYVSIKASTVTLNVNIAAAAVTINIKFTDQSVAVWDATGWFSHQGLAKFWENYTSVIGSYDDTLTLYTVPDGKVLYVYEVTIGWQKSGRGIALYSPGAIYFAGGFVPDHGTLHELLSPPLALEAGKTLYLYLRNDSSDAAYYFYVVRGGEAAV